VKSKSALYQTIRGSFLAEVSGFHLFSIQNLKPHGTKMAIRISAHPQQPPSES
jgi:hypothetical protein